MDAAEAAPAVIVARTRPTSLAAPLTVQVKPVADASLIVPQGFVATGDEEKGAWILMVGALQVGDVPVQSPFPVTGMAVPGAVARTFLFGGEAIFQTGMMVAT